VITALQGFNIASPYGAIEKVNLGGVSLVIKSAEGVFKAVLKNTGGVFSVELEPFTKDVGFNFSWTNGKNLACSVEDIKVYIGDKSYTFDVSGSIYAAAAFSRATGVIAVNTFPDEGSEYKIYTFSKLGEGPPVLTLVDTLTYERINALVFGKKTTSSEIIITIIHNSVVIDTITYKAGVKETTNLFTGATIVRTATFNYTGSNVGSTATVHTTEGFTVATNLGSANGAFETDTVTETVPPETRTVNTEVTEGGSFWNINLCDTKDAITVCEKKIHAFLESTINYQVTGGVRVTTYTSATVYGPLPGEYLIEPIPTYISFSDDYNNSSIKTGTRSDRFFTSAAFEFLKIG
jgi:hypothetical protein